MTGLVEGGYNRSMIKDTVSESALLPGDVVYFTAAWCAPCKQLRPQYGRASVIDSDRTYHIIDVDSCDPDLLAAYGIQSVPKIFVVGEEAEIKARNAQAIVDEVRAMS